MGKEHSLHQDKQDLHVATLYIHKANVKWHSKAYLNAWNKYTELLAIFNGVLCLHILLIAILKRAFSRSTEYESGPF